MKIEIRNRWTNEIILCGEYESVRECLEKNSGANLSGANLYGANLCGADLSRANLCEADLSGANLCGADLSGADLSRANLCGANLCEADLSGANLCGADLSGADLSEADLSGANLCEADLSGADLSGAENIENRYLLPDIYSLKLQSKNTKLRFWKYSINGKSPYQGSIYKVGKTYSEKDFLYDEQQECGKGLNVATLMWCLRDNSTTDEFLEVEFTVGDIVAIPYATDGKFRVKEFKVLRKINRKKAEAILEKAKRVKIG